MACSHPRAAFEYFILVISPRGKRGKVLFDGNIGTESASCTRGVLDACGGWEREKGREREIERELECCLQ